MNPDTQNHEAQLVSMDGLVIDRGSLIARNYDALPAAEKLTRCVRYGGQTYNGDDVLKLLASHQQA